MSEIDVLLQIKDELRGLREQLNEHCSNHPLEHHDHLLDHAEHMAHHAELDKPKERRAGEQRKGERRISTETYSGEERRAG